VGHRADSTEWVDELGMLIDDCFDRNNLYNDLPDSRRAAFFMHPPRLRRGTSLRSTEGCSRLKVRWLSTQNRYGLQTDARVDTGERQWVGRGEGRWRYSLKRNVRLHAIVVNVIGNARLK